MLLLPNAAGSEAAVVASILRSDTDPSSAFEALIPEDFLDLKLRKVFVQAKTLHDQGIAIDLPTLAQAFSADVTQPKIDAGFLVSLLDSSPVSTNLNHFISEVALASHKRRLIKGMGEASRKLASADEKTTEGIIATVEKTVLDIAVKKDRRGIRLPKDILSATLSQLEQTIINRGKITGIATGIASLDAITGGLHKSDLIILGARPGVGKTALALNIAANAFSAGKSTLIFSLEMSEVQLTFRLYSSLGKINAGKFRSGALTDEEIDVIAAVSRDLRTKPFAVDDTPGLAIDVLASRARKYKKDHGLDLLVIDYLQLMRGSPSERREREIAEISGRLKALAKELDIPVLALAQLNRESDKRTGAVGFIPKLSDLRESGAIEQDADVVIFIARYTKADLDGMRAAGTAAPTINGKTVNETSATLVVRKNRHGETGQINVSYVGQYTSFYDDEDEGGYDE